MRKLYLICGGCGLVVGSITLDLVTWWVPWVCILVGGILVLTASYLHHRGK